MYKPRDRTESLCVETRTGRCHRLDDRSQTEHTHTHRDIYLQLFGAVTYSHLQSTNYMTLHTCNGLFSRTTRLSQYQIAKTSPPERKITEADAPTIHPDPIRCPTSIIPHFLCWMPFLSEPSRFILAWAVATLQIYPGSGQALSYAGLHTQFCSVL